MDDRIMNAWIHHFYVNLSRACASISYWCFKTPYIPPLLKLSQSRLPENQLSYGI